MLTKFTDASMQHKGRPSNWSWQSACKPTLKIWVNTSRESTRNYKSTKTKESTTKICAYFMGYTVHSLPYRWWCKMVNPVAANTEMKMSSFWWNLHHWLHWKLSIRQLPVYPMMKISSNWWHFHFREPGGRLNKKDGLTRYGNSHVKDKTS